MKISGFIQSRIPILLCIGCIVLTTLEGEYLVKVALTVPAPSVVIQEYDRPPYPCLGLAHLSSFLKANGVDVLTIDAKFDRLSLNEVEDSLLRFKPDILGFTAMTHEITHVAKAANRLKRILPNSLTIIGGPHVTVAASRTLQDFSIFDIAVIGEGELTLVELVKSMDEFDFNLNISNDGRMTTKSLERLGSIKGIAWRFRNKIRVNEPRELISDLDSLPYPDFDHIKRRIKVYPIFSSRGCPYHCIFCCRVLGNRIRVRSPIRIVDEIKYAINKLSPELVNFADDTFTYPKNRVMETCDLMINERLNRKIKWVANSRVTGVDQNLLNKMKAAGCIKVDFGVESGNPVTLRRIKKGITVADAENAIRMAKKAGLKTTSYFIIGHPYETVQTIRDTIKLATKLNTSTVSFGIMVPYPGTEIYEMAVKGEGNYRIISEKWEDYDKQIGNALELDGLTRKELEKWQRKAYMAFYLHNFRFLDVIRLVIQYRRLLLKMLTK
jgi:anaerobic magnesium-protoporphyrin IX monomethyl ester cyclase